MKIFHKALIAAAVTLACGVSLAADLPGVRILATGGTIAGVKTNLDFQVLREDGSVINGLYAGGETSNREMYAYAYSSGSGVGYALASGRQIGIHLMK